MFVKFGTADLFGCLFHNNRAQYADDAYAHESSLINVNGCPEGYSTKTSGLWVWLTHGGGVIQGDNYNYLCKACDR